MINFVVIISLLFFLFLISIINFFVLPDIISWKIKKEGLKKDMVISKISSSQKEINCENCNKKKIFSIFKKTILIDKGLAIGQDLTKEITFQNTNNMEVINKSHVVVHLLFFFPYKICFS